MNVLLNTFEEFEKNNKLNITTLSYTDLYLVITSSGKDLPQPSNENDFVKIDKYVEQNIGNYTVDGIFQSLSFEIDTTAIMRRWASETL